ncbi:TonB-dependent receptor [Mucilaginibacter sp.]|uniref:TonB-dependent receptor n=1 Tax=Mucilaginibacter sp. TaxID=1882438 RepID=UPI00284C189D|nr:TonB-dependent receptor [Mucilaginibacter sp.]MDR3697354.1 TonB-dependent receptor [Mucilaginibacter sp.]
MKIRLLSFLLVLLFLHAANAQQSPKVTSREVFGTVTDSTGLVPGLKVKLTSAKDSVVMVTNEKGLFDFPVVIAKNFKLTISGIGYQTISRKYVMDNGTKPIKLDPIRVSPQTNMLKEVTISGVIPMVIKEDTIEYKASAYKVRDGSPVEELLKKLPGVSVDANGNVTAQGKQVKKVRVDGKDYFTGDVQTATQNLPADIVESIQIIDDYGDQANLTGIKTGDPDKVLNITIQKGKRKGKFGYGTVGDGNDGRYLGRLSANDFNNDQQIALLGTVNNNNTNIFNLAQAGGSGGRSGKSSGGSSGVSTANGITGNKSAGLNYRDSWGKKITVYGSYSFADKDTKTTTTSQQQDIFQSGSLINDDNTNDENHSRNHRFDFNMEYKIDTLNYLKINPKFSYGSSSDNNADIFSNMRNGQTVNGNEYALTNTSAPGGGATILYNHRFQKKGRNFSITGGYSYSKSTQSLNDKYSTVQDSVVNPLYQQINTNSNTNSFNIHASYLEPIGKTTYLETNYTYSYTNTDNNKYNYRLDPVTGLPAFVDSLSTIYNSQFIYNRFGFNIRGIKPKYNYTVGLSAQPSTLEGESGNFHLNTNTFNFVPTARFVYNFQKSQVLTINYSGNSGQPSFTQLQLTPDYSNPQNVIYGNPYLKPSFSNTINFRYYEFDLKSGSSLFTNLSFNTIENQIISNTEPVVSETQVGGTTVTNSTKQETHYLNANGYYSMNSNYSISQPFDNRKFTVTLLGSATYNNNISYIENERNLGKNWILTQGAKLRIDIDSVMDTEINGSYSINNTAYTLPSSINTNARTWTIGLDGRNYFFYSWILGYNLTQTINHGFSSTVVENPTLLSTYVEYQFLKKNAASIRFQAFDLFNENAGISRPVSGNQIIDTRTNRLGRYFMLSFTMRLQQFAGQQKRGNGGGFRNGGGGRRGGMGN